MAHLVYFKRLHSLFLKQILSKAAIHPRFVDNIIIKFKKQLVMRG